MPWKNGQGFTEQIDIESINSNHFLWRLSSAKVSGESFFSIFHNCNRILTILKGDGLYLNGQILKQGDFYKFSGEDQICCQTIKDDVIDLGLIYDKRKFFANHRCEELGAGQKRKQEFSGLVMYIFCQSGSFQVSEISVRCSDTLKINGPIRFEVEAYEDCKLIVFGVEDIK